MGREERKNNMTKDEWLKKHGIQICNANYVIGCMQQRLEEATEEWIEEMTEAIDEHNHSLYCHMTGKIIEVTNES